MPHPQRGGGGVARLFAQVYHRLHSSICLITLWLSSFEAALARFGRGRMKGGGRERPPQKQGGHAVPHRWHLGHASVPAPMGSLTSSFIPAGRLGTAPLSPRASSCRIGPRRPGFVSPLRALDGCGPIRKTRCLRGERGGRAGEHGAGEVSRMLEELSGLLAYDKGYYHACLGRSRKGTFRPYQPP